MKHTVATCAHLLAVAQLRRLVDAELDAIEWCGGHPRSSTVAAGGAGKGTGEGARHEVRGQMGRSRLEGRTP
jgi:hypothetical protein